MCGCVKIGGHTSGVGALLVSILPLRRCHVLCVPRSLRAHCRTQRSNVMYFVCLPPSHCCRNVYIFMAMYLECKKDKVGLCEHRTPTLPSFLPSEQRPPAVALEHYHTGPPSFPFPPALPSLLPTLSVLCFGLPPSASVPVCVLPVDVVSPKQQLPFH